MSSGSASGAALADGPGAAPEPSSARLHSPARVLARACGGITAVAGALVLLGWALRIEVLKSPVPGQVSMKANTAVSLVLLGTSLLLVLDAREGSVRLRVGQLLGLAVALIGLLTLAEWVFGLSLGIDQLLFKEPAGAIGTSVPGRPAPSTALCLLAYGLVPFLLDRRRGTLAAQVLAASAWFVALLGFLPYLYGSPQDRGFFGRTTQIAPQTAVVLLVLGVGSLCARPGRGLMRILTSDSVGGFAARRLLPAAVGFPLLAGWLAVAGQKAGLYDADFRASVVGTASGAALAVLVGVGARSVDRAEARRRHAETIRTEVFLHNPSAINITRLSDGRYTDVNEAFTRIFGWPREEAVGRTAVELGVWDPDARERILEEILDRGEVRGMQASLRTRSGDAVSVEFSARVIDLDGEPHLVVTSQDVSERQRLEQALRESETRLRTALETVQDPFAIMSAARDGSGRIVDFVYEYVNDALCSLNQRSREELIGGRLLELFPAHVPSGLFDDYCRVVETGEPLAKDSFTYEDVVGGGRRLVLGLDMRAVKFGDGYIVSGHDVTERERAEEEIRRSSERLEALNQVGRDILSTRSRDELASVALNHVRSLVPCLRASLSRFDPQTQELVMFTVSAEGETEVGRGTRFPLSVVGPPDRLLRGEINRVADTLEVEDPPPSVRSLIKEGVRSYVNVPMMGGGELVGTLNISSATPGGFTDEHLAVAREVADLLTVALVQSDLRDELRRRAEELEERVLERTATLAESEARFRLLLANAPDAVLVVDSARAIGLANERAGSLFGYDEDEMVGMSLDELVPEEYRSIHATQVGTYLNDPVPRPMGAVPALRGRRKDGTEFSADISLGFVHARRAGEEPLGIAFVRDVTERMRLEEEIVAAKDEAERANRAKDEFLSRMSHELRTPLNSIAGFAQLLAMEAADERQAESAGQILKAGRHLLGLIDEILDISRISAGRIGISPEPIAVAAIINDAVDTVRPLAAERGVSIHVEDANGLHVLADRQRLIQVLLNVLSNAIKYNREGGEIRVSWSKGVEGRLAISVADTGAGIPTDQQHLLFTPFERLGAERTGIEGTGLGLALTRSLVDAMGGTIGVESAPGEGSVFTVDLALAEAPVARYERETVRRAEPRSSDEERTILHVEDNPSNLALIERILERRPGVRLLSAMQGRLGLDLAREHLPDLVLLDLHLPDMPGEEAIRLLRQDAATRRIPVVVISADATQGQMKRLLAAGADDYITKPLDLEAFLRTIDRFLG